MADHGEETLALEHETHRGAYRVEARFRGRTRGRTVRLGETFCIGSGCEVEITVEDPAVSARHCELRVADSGVWVRDLGSTNGLWVGAGRVQEALIGPSGGVFVLGQTEVEVRPKSQVEAEPSLGLLGHSEPMKLVRQKLRAFARVSAPVLITGESGTGKDLAARALHFLSGRSGSYLALNAAALPDGLMESELFGHSRGAFTGANVARAGAFELADHGTLFLDELAELSPRGQARLLRVVEDGLIRPLGQGQSKQVDVRLVTATCAPLAERVRKGQFREDLYHRLGVLRLEMPKLRERREDIPLLVRAFLEARRDELGAITVLPETMELLKKQLWRGNVRQLLAAVYRAAVLCDGGILSPAQVELEGVESPNRPRLRSAEEARRLLGQHGSVSAAARAAGLPRTTFRSLLGGLGSTLRAPCDEAGTELSSTG